MRVEITHPRSYQDAGSVRQLNVGQVYDLPDVVALSLVATGAAKPAAGAPQRAPERKPTGASERKG